LEVISVKQISFWKYTYAIAKPTAYMSEEIKTSFYN